MASVFISYSRRDGEFVQRLHEALVARDYEVWVDWQDIPPSAEWPEEIRAGIDGADGIIFVISPDSAVSSECAREIEYAADQHKRIVPVVRRDPDSRPLPERVAALNWVFMRDEDTFDSGVEALVTALQTDLEHVRTHTRLGVAARRWDASGGDRSQLLRGAELASSERWLVAVGDKQPQPTELQRRYLLASRQAATRRQRALIGGISLALVVAIALSVVALVQRSIAIHERQLATARYLDAAAQSNYTFDPQLSVLLAEHAAQIAPGSTTEEVLREALARSNLRATYSFAGATTAPDAVWSPDRTRLLATSPGRAAMIYSPGTNAPPVTLPPPSANQQAVWDARGDRILIGGASPAVYDARTGRLVARIPGIAVFVALSSDGSRAATTDASFVGHVFDVSSGKLLSSFHPRYRGGVTCIAWAPDDSVLAQCDAKSTAVSTAPAALDVWDPHTGRLLHSDQSPHFIDSVAFSPDSRRYVYTTTTGNASQRSLTALARAEGEPGTFVFDTRTGAQVIAFPGSASAAAFSPDGSEVAYATTAGDLGHVYNFVSGLNQPLVGSTAVINSISFSRAGAYVVTSSDDQTARVYDPGTGSLVESLADGDTGTVLSASFGLDDTMIATTSTDGKARLWTSPNPRPAARITLAAGSAPAASVGFSFDGNRVVEAGLAREGQTGLGEILDARSLRMVAGFTAPAGYRFAGAGASRDGRVVAALAFRTVAGKLAGEVAETFDARSGRLLATMTPTTPGATTTNASLNYAGDRLVTDESSGAAEVWDPRTGGRLALLPGAGPAVVSPYSPDGSMLAVVHMPPLPAQLTFQNETQLGAVTVDLWDGRTGSLLRRLIGPRPMPLIPGVKQFASLAVTFSFNGRVVALAGANHEVWAWSTRTGAPIQPLQVPDGQFAVSLGFSPNDRMIAAGTASGAYVWNLSTTSAPLPEFKHADPSQFSLLTGGAVYVGFTRDSRILVTAGDLALKAWSVTDHLQLFDAFAARGTLDYDGTRLVAAAGNRLSLYPCDLCGGLPQLLAVARREVTRGLTPQEIATYLRSG